MGSMCGKILALWKACSISQADGFLHFTQILTLLTFGRAAIPSKNDLMNSSSDQEQMRSISNYSMDKQGENMDFHYLFQLASCCRVFQVFLS